MGMKKVHTLEILEEKEEGACIDWLTSLYAPIRLLALAWLCLDSWYEFWALALAACAYCFVCGFSALPCQLNQSICWAYSFFFPTSRTLHFVPFPFGHMRKWLYLTQFTEEFWILRRFWEFKTPKSLSLSPGIEVPKADEITMEPDLLAAAQFITRKKEANSLF